MLCAQDDGAILCVMVDGRANNTFLLVLDASECRVPNSSALRRVADLLCLRSC